MAGVGKLGQNEDDVHGPLLGCGEEPGNESPEVVGDTCKCNEGFGTG